jgi:hypothetical protein
MIKVLSHKLGDYEYDTSVASIMKLQKVAIYDGLKRFKND